MESYWIMLELAVGHIDPHLSWWELILYFIRNCPGVPPVVWLLSKWSFMQNFSLKLCMCVCAYTCTHMHITGEASCCAVFWYVLVLLQYGVASGVKSHFVRKWTSNLFGDEKMVVVYLFFQAINWIAYVIIHYDIQHWRAIYCAHVICLH